MNPNERVGLVAWVRRLRPAALAALLADRATERKLLEMRANEPELRADGRSMDLALRASLSAGAAAILVVGLSTAI